jgi:transcriptional regulator with XRE-family HTH domain
MPSRESFGTYLRRQRELYGLTLDHVAGVTKISKSLLAALEQDDVSKWPEGIFRRAFFRAYASTIGLDPAPLMDDFARLAARSNEKIRPRIATAEFHRPYSTTLRLTLAAPESWVELKKESVAAALFDGLVVFALALVATSAARGHVAIGIAAAVAYHAVPKALGWQTLGATFLRLVTAGHGDAPRARIEEGRGVHWRQPSGTPERKPVLRSVDGGARSRRVG